MDKRCITGQALCDEEDNENGVICGKIGNKITRNNTTTRRDDDTMEHCFLRYIWKVGVYEHDDHSMIFMCFPIFSQKTTQQAQQTKRGDR